MTLYHDGIVEFPLRPRLTSVGWLKFCVITVLDFWCEILILGEIGILWILFYSNATNQLNCMWYLFQFHDTSSCNQTSRSKLLYINFILLIFWIVWNEFFWFAYNSWQPFFFQSYKNPRTWLYLGSFAIICMV